MPSESSQPVRYTSSITMIMHKFHDWVHINIIAVYRYLQCDSQLDEDP